MPTFRVVYHLVPTSNHNKQIMIKAEDMLFIILFLHQTTTLEASSFVRLLLFIILFLHQTTTAGAFIISSRPLFIILFLHQTTTHKSVFLLPQRCLSSCSYIKPQLKRPKCRSLFVVYHLVPTSNHNALMMPDIMWTLFIILFLHQTTTVSLLYSVSLRCLSSCSYIKPQLGLLEIAERDVVYHLVPTSNHNL